MILTCSSLWFASLRLADKRYVVTAFEGHSHAASRVSQDQPQELYTYIIIQCLQTRYVSKEVDPNREFSVK